MKDLTSRKQFLIAQNELSRAELIEDFTSLKAELRTLTHRADSLRIVVSSAALLVSGLTAFHRGRRGDSEAKPSWWRTLLKGAGAASTIWLALQLPGRDR